MANPIMQSISALKTADINFLALDFDLTIVDIHTGGTWPGTIEELATHVRDIFKQLIFAAHEAGIQMAICTFSPQVAVIREVLALTFPNFGEDIPIRGADRSWTYEGEVSLHF